MSNDNLDLPHLVQVCEEYISAKDHFEEADKSASQAIRMDAMRRLTRAHVDLLTNIPTSTVLSLLRRLMEADERVKQLEDVIHPPSIAQTGGMFAGLPEHLQPQGVDPAYFRERKAT